MVDWSNQEFLLSLTFDIIAVTFAVWWLSRRVKSKIDEVNLRKSKRWEREDK